MFFYQHNNKVFNLGLFFYKLSIKSIISEYNTYDYVILNSKIYKFGLQKVLNNPEYPPANELLIKLALILGKEIIGASIGNPTLYTFSYYKYNRLAFTF